MPERVPLSPVLDHRPTYADLKVLATDDAMSDDVMSDNTMSDNAMQAPLIPPSPPTHPKVSNALALIDDQILGTVVAVSWSYILQQQIDAEGTCPANGDERCWFLVAALAINTIAGAYYLPAVTVFIVKITSDRIAGLRRDSFQRGNVGLFRKRMSVALRVQKLGGAAAAMCWSVSASGFVFYLLAQLEVEATNGEVQPPGHGPRGREGWRDQESEDGCDTHMINSYLLRVSGVIAVVAVSSTTLCVIVQLLASRRLKSPLTHASPFKTEQCLLLSKSLYCAMAVGGMSLPSLFLFPCYELSLGSAGTQLAWAFVRCFFFLVAGWRISAFFARDRDGKDDDALLLVLATSVRRCFTFMLIQGCAVISCLGVHDFVSTLIASDVLELSDGGMLALWFFYAVLLTAIAVVRGGLRDEASEEEQHALAHERYVDTFESWLVCFAWWLPFKEVLEGIYNLLPSHVSGAYVEAGTDMNFWLQHLLRLVFQVLISVAFTLAFAVLSVVVRPDK